MTAGALVATSDSVASRISHPQTTVDQDETAGSSRQARPECDSTPIHRVSAEVARKRPMFMRPICLGSAPPLLPSSSRSNQPAGRATSIRHEWNIPEFSDLFHRDPTPFSCISATAGGIDDPDTMDARIYCCVPVRQLCHLHGRLERVPPHRGVISPGP